MNDSLTIPMVFTLSLVLAFFVPTFSLSAETWDFSADEVTSIRSESEKRTVLDGNARVDSEQREIRANHLELSGSDYALISGRGDVRLRDLKRNLTVSAGRFEYDRKKKIIRFREQVTLVDEAEGIVIRCESLDFLEEVELVIMQVSVRLIKDKTVCRGEFATFRRDENILNITGVPVVWRDDDEYRADRIQVDLNTDEIVMEGEVAGSLKTGKNDE